MKPLAIDEQIEQKLKNRAYEVSYVNNDRRKDIIITPQDKLAQETLAYIDRLKEACNEAIRSFTRMETLYKLKCNEIKTVKAKTVREFAERIETLCKEHKDRYSHLCKSKKECNDETCRYQGVLRLYNEIKELVKEVCGE